MKKFWMKWTLSAVIALFALNLMAQQTPAADRREDVRDKREDRRDRAENKRDRAENKRDRREDRRDVKN